MDMLLWLHSSVVPPASAAVDTVDTVAAAEPVVDTAAATEPVVVASAVPAALCSSVAESLADR